VEDFMTLKTARRIFAFVLISSLIPAAALAQSAGGGRSAGIGLRGWGPRVGFSSSPDQVIGGVQFDLGEFASDVRFQPSVEVGFGDDVTTLQANFMVSYYFPVQAQVTPYAGGEITAAFYDFDTHCPGFNFGRPCDDSDTKIGPAAVGGIETKLRGGSRFLAEIQIGFSDVPDAKIVAGWLF
jgi:hypothetical protein